MVPVVKCIRNSHKPRGGVHAYQSSLTNGSPCLVHIAVPAVVIHHVRERGGEREIETVEKNYPSVILPVSCHNLRGKLVNLIAVFGLDLL